MGTRFAFDYQAAIKAAWDLLWASNLKTRAEDSHYRPSTTYYLTASDLMWQVRQFAEETAAGEPWGKRGRAYSGGYGSRVRLSGDLLHMCRDWLRNEEYAGRLASHNFGRGHVSGKRYRPAGEPISEAETNTFAVKAQRASKPRPVHMWDSTRKKSFLCAPEKKSRWGRYRSQAHVSRGATPITCPRCLKLMQPKETA
jgi:hypothetical protein